MSVTKKVQNEFDNYGMEEKRKDYICGIAEGVQLFLESNYDDFVKELSDRLIGSLNITLKITEKTNSED